MSVDVERYITYIHAISMYSVIISTRDTLKMGYAAPPAKYTGDNQLTSDYIELFGP